MMSVNIFISYSHKDIQYKKELEHHLSVVKRWYNAKIWSDELIKSGEKLNEVILNKLNGADIVIYLISSDFLDSTYCYDTEFQTIYEKQKYQKVIIIPAVTRPCGWIYDENIKSILSATFEGKSISEYENRDLAYLQIVEQVVKNIKDLNKLVTEKKYMDKKLPDCIIEKNDINKENIIEEIMKFCDQYDTVFLHSEQSVKNSEEILTFFINSYVKSEEINKSNMANTLFDSLIDNFKVSRLSIDILSKLYECYPDEVERVFMKYADDEKFYGLDVDIVKGEKWSNNPLYLLNKFSVIVNLFFEIPDLFKIIPDKYKLSIKIKSSENLNFSLMTYFCNRNLKEHFEQALNLLDEMQNKYYNTHNWIENYEVPVYNGRIIRLFYKIAEKTNEIENYNNFLIEIIKRSHCYSYSEDIIEDILYHVSKGFKNDEVCKKIVESMRNNSQFSGLGKYGNSKHKTLNEMISKISELKDYI